MVFQKGHPPFKGTFSAGGKKHSDISKTKIGDSQRGKSKSYLLGIPKSKEHRRKLSLANRGRRTGAANHNWLGGISSNPYPSEFNETLKLRVRNRDNFTCCVCGRTEREELEELNRALCVNHIDFNKQNCAESNLNTLCIRCNVKINRNREYWMDFFST